MILPILLAAASVIVNGDFEDVCTTPKSTSRNIMAQLRLGWEFTHGPIAFCPNGWRTASGLGYAWSVDLRETPEKKDCVRSGHASLQIGAKNGKVACVMMNQPLRPGRYHLSLWTRGEAQLRIDGYAVSWQGRHIHSPGPMRIGEKDGKIVIPPSKEWTHTDMDIEFGTFADNPREMYFAFEVRGNGLVCIDDLAMTPLEEKK